MCDISVGIYPECMCHDKQKLVIKGGGGGGFIMKLRELVNMKKYKSLGNIHL